MPVSRLQESGSVLPAAQNCSWIFVTKRNTVPSLGERLTRSEARVGQDGFLGPSRLRAAADDVHGKQ